MLQCHGWTRALWKLYHMQTVKETVVVEKVVVATPAPKQQITLRFMDISGEQGDFQRAFSRTFEDRNPGITIENETLGWGDLVTKVAVAVSAGTMADLAFQHGALMLPGLAQKGAWLDLTPLAEADNHDFSIYYDWAVNTLRQGPQGRTGGHALGCAHRGLGCGLERADVREGLGGQSAEHSEDHRRCRHARGRASKKMPDVWGVIPNDAGHSGMEADWWAGPSKRTSSLTTASNAACWRQRPGCARLGLRPGSGHQDTARTTASGGRPPEDVLCTRAVHVYHEPVQRVDGIHQGGAQRVLLRPRRLARPSRARPAATPSSPMARPSTRTRAGNCSSCYPPSTRPSGRRSTRRT